MAFTDYSLRYQLKINPAYVNSGINGQYFQLYVYLGNNSTIGNVIQDTAAGKDIAFFDPLTHELYPFEKVHWSWTSASAWTWRGYVRIPAISSSAYTYVGVGFGLAGATDISNSAGTFPTTDGFYGVYHLANQSYKDSSGNQPDGSWISRTGSGFAWTVGPTGGGYGYPSAYSGFTSVLDLGTGLNGLWDPLDAVTVSFWFIDYSQSGMGTLMSKSNTDNTHNGAIIAHSGSQMSFATYALSDQSVSHMSIGSYRSTVQAWQRHHYNFRSNNYIQWMTNQWAEGYSSSSVNNSDYQNPANNHIYLMNTATGSRGGMKGYMADVWFRGIGVPNTRLYTEYYNQAYPWNFYSMETYGTHLTASPLLSYAKPTSTGRLEVCITMGSTSLIRAYAKPIGIRGDVCHLSSPLGARAANFGNERFPWSPRPYGKISAYSRVTGVFAGAFSQYNRALLQSKSKFQGDFIPYVPAGAAHTLSTLQSESGILFDLWYWPDHQSIPIESLAALSGVVRIRPHSTVKASSRLTGSALATSVRVTASPLISRSRTQGYRREQFPFQGQVLMPRGYVNTGYAKHGGFTGSVTVAPGSVLLRDPSSAWLCGFRGSVLSSGLSSGEGYASFPKIRGITYRGNEPGQSLVVLYDADLLTFIRSLWSGDDGVFEMSGLEIGKSYLVGVYDVYGGGNSIMYEHMVGYIEEKVL